MARAVDPVILAMERNWDMIEGALDGLDDATMAQQPTGQCNSIAWTLWHLTRVTDMFLFTRLRDLTQIWVKDGWHQKFGMAADQEDRGVGWTAAQVAAWDPPSREIQIGYYQAVKAAAKEYLSTVTDEELDRKIVMGPVPEPRPVGTCMGQMVWDTVAHGGQIAYLRGFFKGMGWFPR